MKLKEVLLFVNLIYLITKLDDRDEDFAGGMHVRAVPGLLLQTEEQLQGFVQLVFFSKFLGQGNLLGDQGRAVHLHLDDLTGSFGDDFVDPVLGVALLLGRGLLCFGGGHFRSKFDQKMLLCRKILTC